MVETGDLAERSAAYLGLLRQVGDPAEADRLRLGVQIWSEAVRNPRVRDLAKRNVDDPRRTTAAALAAVPGVDPDALARVLIAIYQGLQLQTAWDETVDNEAYVRTVAALLDAARRG